MPETPYDRPSDPRKRHSAAITDGPSRAGARSMLKAIGFDDEALAKPIIGVATCWIETMPCNFNHRALAQKVKQGIREAGGTPMEFNTISVSDGVTMGTEGMRGSLVSREVIADSIELVARSHGFDGVVCLVACDKTGPAAAMALARLERPGLIFYTGSIAPGVHNGNDVTVMDVYEGDRREHRGHDERTQELHQLEDDACPAPAPAAASSPRTRWRWRWSSSASRRRRQGDIPATHPTKAEAAVEIGHMIMDLVERDVRASDLITRESLENALASVAASGGSTNGVMHLIAIARELEIPLTLEDVDRVMKRTPIVASLQPGGKYNATDLFAAGGSALVAAELVQQDLLHVDAMTVDRPHDRRARGERARRRPASRSSSRSPSRSSRTAASRCSGATSRPRAA